MNAKGGGGATPFIRSLLVWFRMVQQLRFTLCCFIRHTLHVFLFFFLFLGGIQ